MNEQLADKITEALFSGEATATKPRRVVTIRFGINPNDPGRVQRNYTDADEWLVVRRVRKRSFDKTLWISWHGGRVRSRRNLERVIRDMCRGSDGGYVEVLPWRPDDDYPKPHAPKDVLGEVTT